MKAKMYFLFMALPLFFATACTTDIIERDFEEGIANGEGTPDSGNDSSGDDLDFDISIDLDESGYIEGDEVIPTDSKDADFDDFIENSDFTKTVNICFEGNTADVTNLPEGIEATVSGAHVTISSTIKKVEYIINGTTDNGSLKIYSDNKFKLTLNGADIANPTGAAINIQSKKRAFVAINDETANKLTDGSSYTLTGEEDMKACLFSEGQLIFSGSGTLTVTGNYKHAICSDEYVRFRKGNNITIASAVKDGIHTNDSIIIGGGRIKISAAGDGMDCEEGGIRMTAGTVLAQVSGEGSKGLKCSTDMELVAGRIVAVTTGDCEYKDNDLTSAAAIKCDGTLTLDEAVVEVKSTGNGGKGINCDGNIIINGGTLKVITTGKQHVYGRLDSSSKGVKSDGNITINGGEIKVKATGGEGSEGIESKNVLTINGGIIEVVTYDDCLNASTNITITGGKISCYSSGNDGIDSNGTLTITGGTVIAAGTTSPEEGFDCDQNTFTITGGTIIGIGGGTSTPTSNQCTQPVMIYGGSGTAGQYIYLATTDGAEVITYKIPRTYNQMALLVSSPVLVQGNSYILTSGGSISGGSSFHGLMTGSTYSNGSPLASFTASSMITTCGSTNGNMGGGNRPGWH